MINAKIQYWNLKKCEDNKINLFNITKFKENDEMKKNILLVLK